MAAHFQRAGRGANGTGFTPGCYHRWAGSLQTACALESTEIEIVKSQPPLTVPRCKTALFLADQLAWLKTSYPELLNQICVI